MGAELWSTSGGRKIALVFCWLAPALALVSFGAWLVASYSGAFSNCPDTPCGMVQLIVMLAAVMPLLIPVAGLSFLPRWMRNPDPPVGLVSVLWRVWLIVAPLTLLSSWVILVYQLIWDR